MKDSIMIQKASDFAVAIIELNKVLLKKKEYEISGQIKRSGTAIGALICEAQFAESPADFIHKMRIALKECHLCDYLDISYFFRNFARCFVYYDNRS